MPDSPNTDTPRQTRETLLRLGLFFILATLGEAWIYATVLARVGAPSVPLDDSFIHFQYARSIAELHPFRYGSALDAPSSGATSVLYPLLLAIPYALGMKALRIVLAAHAIGAVAWALAAEGFFRIGRALGGRAFGAATAALPFACAGILWTAGSCMETLLAVAVAALALGLALDLDVSGARRHAVALAAVGSLGPLVRPEFMALSLGAALAIAWRAPRSCRRWALLPALATPAVPVFWKLMTGEWTTTGAQVKLLFASPYSTRVETLREVGGNIQAIYRSVLAGHGWAQRFLPQNFHLLALVGAMLGVRRWRVAGRPLSVVVWIAGLAMPMLVGPFGGWNWHRYRYLWPGFTTCLIAGLFAVWSLGAFVGARLPPRSNGRSLETGAAALGAGALLVVLGVRVPAAVTDLAHCSLAIHQQHVAAASEHVQRLPADAPVLVNDAGALAYLGGHRTVDFVGLTTPGFALATRNGPGSTFEQLEMLAPDDRPRFAALYRAWLQGDEYLDADLATVVVRDHAILGGDSKSIARVRHELFGTGELPLDGIPSGFGLSDALDVARIDDERRHELQVSPARRDLNLTRVYPGGRGAVADGGRIVEREMRFVLRAVAGRPARLILRTDAWFDSGVAITWNGEALGEIPVSVLRRFVDLAIEVPPGKVLAENRVIASPVRAPNFGAFHWFLLQPAPSGRPS